MLKEDVRRFISLPEAAQALDLTQRYVMTLIRSGSLVGGRWHKHWYADREDVARLVRERAEAGSR